MYVTAMFDLKKKGNFSEHGRTICVTLKALQYADVARMNGISDLVDAKTGMPVRINLDECAAISCGPERPEP